MLGGGMKRSVRGRGKERDKVLRGAYTNTQS